MTIVKKISVAAVSLALAALTAVSLTGCGEQVAATWAHGKVLEDEITQTATTQMSYHTSSDGSTDVSAWTNYIADREYDSSASSADSSSTDSSTKTDSKSDDSAKSDGTVQEYREYLINQAIRQQVIDYEIEQRNITVSDDEIDQAVEQQSTIYESYYGGGHKGTFESILSRYFGMTLEQFKEDVANNLKEDKLKEAVLAEQGSSDDSASTDDSASDDSKKSSKKAKSSDSSTDTSSDDDKKFDEYIDNLIAGFDVKINDAPADLAYDPQVVAKNANSSEDSGSSDSSDSADSSSDSSDAATSSDGDSSK